MKSEVSHMKVGVIGLGAMGAPMAMNLHKAGYLKTVWNRTPGKAEALSAAYPVMIATDPAELAAQCELVLTCVSRDEDVLEVVAALLPGLQVGSIVIDTSTVSRETAREAARQLSSVGAEFLDAPVSGGPEGATEAMLAMMVGGREDILQRAHPALTAITAVIVHMGAIGSGQAAKAVNQIMAAGINQAVSEALAFGQAMGLPMATVVEAISQGAAANTFLARRGANMLEGSFEPGFKLALHHKDLVICKAMADEFDVQLPIIEMTLIHYKRLIEAGHGEEDISALFRHKQRLFEEKK